MNLTDGKRFHSPCFLQQEKLVGGFNPFEKY